jgi:hypothetical protein
MVAREVDSLKHAVRALKQGTASPVSVHAPCHPAHALHCTALHCTALHCMTRAVASHAHHGYCLGLDRRVLDTPSQHASPVVMQSCMAWLCHWPCSNVSIAHRQSMSRLRPFAPSWVIGQPRACVCRGDVHAPWPIPLDSTVSLGCLDPWPACVSPRSLFRAHFILLVL